MNVNDVMQVLIEDLPVLSIESLSDYDDSTLAFAEDTHPTLRNIYSIQFDTEDPRFDSVVVETYLAALQGDSDEAYYEK